MRNGSAFITILLAALVSWATVHFTQTPQAVTGVSQKETAYQRVMRTKTLRCGYVPYAPQLIKDANTGEFSGISYDIVSKIAELTHLKLEWVAETTWANYPLDLQSGKFDALCTLDFTPPPIIGRIEMTQQPLFLTTLGVYKRKGDTRFENGFRDLNRSDIKISAIDGSVSMMLRDALYPKAGILSLPSTSDYSVILENVANGKADLTFVERAVANGFMKANPDKIEDITGDTPLIAYPYIFSVAKGEIELSRLFDQAIMVMQFYGDVEKALNKHAPGDYIAVDPYKNYKMSN